MIVALLALTLLRRFGELSIDDPATGWDGSKAAAQYGPNSSI